MSNVQESFKSIYGEEPHELESILDREEARGHFERGYKAALADIEKCEPVAYAWKDDKLCYWLHGQHTWNDIPDKHLLMPLYEKPQPREWVGLSDSEISDFAREMVKADKSVNWLASKIEAKLKQLNTKG